MRKLQTAAQRVSRRDNRAPRHLRLVSRAPLLDVAQSVAETVALRRPTAPLHCLRPQLIRATAARFVAGFAGDVHYAVKCNPE